MGRPVGPLLASGSLHGGTLLRRRTTCRETDDHTIEREHGEANERHTHTSGGDPARTVGHDPRGLWRLVPGSPLGPGTTGGDGALFTASGNGPGGGDAIPAGDGVCDGTGPGDGTCDGTGTGPHGPGYGNGNGPANGACDGTGPGDGTCTCTPTGPDPDDLETLLVAALQEEYLAESTYRRVLADFGDEVMPFSVIADSEQRHVEALLGLFTKREWAAPDSVWNTGNVAGFATLHAACAGGVAVEVEDVALYDRLLARDDLPCDATNVFTHLRAASLDSHLPAFERCQ